MATLVARINDLALSIRDKLNLMTPRLWPSGSTPFVPAKGVGFSISTTAANQVVPAPPSPYAFTVTAASGITAKAQTAATASTVYTLKKSATTVATLTWAASATTATVSGFTATSVAVGDVLTLNGPATADGTLAAISVSVVGG